MTRHSTLATATPPPISAKISAKIISRLVSAVTLSALSLALGASWPEAALAQAGPFDDDWQPREQARAYPRAFNGTFSAVEARLGLTQLGGQDYDGASLDVGARMAFPMLIGDLRLGYRHDRLEPGASSSLGLGELRAHSIMASLALHPLYLVLLGNDWLSYSIASLYVDLGLGAQLTWSQRRGDGASFGQGFDAGFAWHWGAGLDVPLWDADHGHAPWLNLLYRNQRTGFSLSDTRRVSLSMHTIFVGLSWRFNRLLF